VFDIRIDLLSFLIPMRLLGGLFHRHFPRQIPWEVKKNLARLLTQWSEAVAGAIQDLHGQALESIRVELETLTTLLGQRPGESEGVRDALNELSTISVEDSRSVACQAARTALT